MNLDEIIKNNKGLLKITPDVIKYAFSKIMKYPIDMNKTWSNNGCDELDIIEILMEIENILDIRISDHVGEYLFNSSAFPPNFAKYYRDKKLNELGI